MENQFAAKMATISDAELLIVVNERRGDYVPEAILAAEQELSGRNLSFERIESAKHENMLREEIKLDRANEPLGSGWKGLAFVFPGVLPLMFSGSFKADGYDRKAKELLMSTLFGVGFYAIIIIMLLSFKLMPITATPSVTLLLKSVK